jgi:hypothetical protein
MLNLLISLQKEKGERQLPDVPQKETGPNKNHQDLCYRFPPPGLSDILASEFN